MPYSPNLSSIWYHVSFLELFSVRRKGLLWRKHSDTEIDWETYMIQTKQTLQGQHNYSLITGPTGGLVSVQTLPVWPLRLRWSFSQLSCWTCTDSSILIQHHRSWKQYATCAAHLRDPLLGNFHSIVQYLSFRWKHPKLGYFVSPFQQATALHLRVTFVQWLLVGASCTSCNTCIST